MEVSRQELAERFRDFTDEELVRHLQSEALTPLATEVATDELRSRGIEPRKAPDRSGAAPRDPPKEDPPEEAQTDLVTVAEFWNPLQANLLRAFLESHGVFAFVWGEHLGTANVLLSVAGGGSRVQVPGNQVAQAKELMRALEQGELEIPEAGEDPPR